MKAVEASIITLTEYAQLFMQSVFSSVGQCPALLRMALRQLWARVAERFTGHENAVSGWTDSWNPSSTFPSHLPLLHLPSHLPSL